MPPLDPFQTPDPLPPKADVVIVGGGIVGTCLSLFLAERGLSAVVCEKGLIGGEQSGRNLGWCRPVGRDYAELPLGAVSLDLWCGLNERIGADTGFRQSGRLFVCENDEDIRSQEELAVKGRPHGIDVRRLEHNEIRQYLPQGAQRWAAVYHIPGDGKSEPARSATAIARAAQARGVKVLTHCAVVDIETVNGRVTAVTTEKGRVVCSQIVLAAGAWTGVFCRRLGIHFPIVRLVTGIMRTRPYADGPRGCIGGSRFGMTEHLDGSYSLSPFAVVISMGPDALRFARQFLPGLRQRRRALHFRFDKAAIRGWLGADRWRSHGPTPFERERVIERPGPKQKDFRHMIERVRCVLPGFSEADVAQRWSGVIDGSPDSIPTIDAAPGIEGLWLAGGFSGHGFSYGPGAAHLLADFVTGRTPITNPTPYRIARFARHG